MAITVLTTKIESKVKSERENNQRITNLVKYCADPTNKNSHEKCVLFQAFNFPEENPTLAEVIDGFKYDISQTIYKNHELISHWVMSWNGGHPPQDDIISSAQQLLGDLGYDDHKFTVAIHADTDHTHAHICASRVDHWSGRLLQEGNNWWKNESQRSLAGIAHAHGWETEAGNLFKVPSAPIPQMEITEIITLQGEIIEKSVLKIVPVKKDATLSLSSKSVMAEKRTGTKSSQRQLQEKLNLFLEQHKKSFPVWIMQDFHQALSTMGIVCQRTKHGQSYGVSFSMEDDIWFPAVKVCRALTYPKLEKMFEKWTDREEKHTKLAQIRRGVQTPEPTIRELPKIELTKKELSRLRKIPPAKVFAALGMEPVLATSRGRPVKTAFDVCFLAGKTYAEAGHFLAETFPDALEEKTDSMGMPIERRTFSKEELKLLRNIPPQKVFDALGIPPQQERNGRIIKSAFDVCFLANMSYTDAAVFLAEKFPDALQAKSIPKSPLHKYKFSEAQEDRLRNIPVEWVFEKLGIPKTACDKNGFIIKTAFDVCYHAGIDYKDAAQHLNAMFPEILKIEEEKPFTKEQMALLRKIPVADVFKSLNIPPAAKDKKGRPIRNAVDVCIYAGQHYIEAMEFLAVNFPWALSRESAQVVLEQKVTFMLEQYKPPVKPNINLENEIQRRDGVWETRREMEYEIAMDKEVALQVARTMAALRIEKISVYTGIEQDGELKNRRDFGTHDFGGFVKIMPSLKKECLNRPGSCIRPFFEPVSEESAFVCVSDDAQSPMPEKYPPNAVIKDGNTNFHVYALAQKYSSQFYDFLTDSLRHAYRTIQRHLPLPGFGEAEIESFSWEFPHEMERYAAKAHTKWKDLARCAEPATSREELDLAGPVSEIGKNSEWRKREIAITQQSTPQSIEILNHLPDCEKMIEFAESERVQTVTNGNRLHNENNEYAICKFDSTVKRILEPIKIDNGIQDLEQKANMIDHNQINDEHDEMQEMVNTFSLSSKI